MLVGWLGEGDGGNYSVKRREKFSQFFHWSRLQQPLIGWLVGRIDFKSKMMLLLLLGLVGVVGEIGDAAS